MPSEKVNYQEKRKYPRFKTFSVIKIINDNGGSVSDAHLTLVNISEGGLCFYSSDQMKAKDRIRLNVEIPELNSSVTVHTRIVWSQPSLEHPLFYLSGGEFIDIGETDRDILRRWKKVKEDKKSVA